MSEELALQKVQELREVVEGDEVGELVDTLATMLILRQDMTDPMYGAKVTYYDMPEGEWVEVDKSEFVGEDRWNYRHDTTEGKWKDDWPDERVEHTYMKYVDDDGELIEELHSRNAIVIEADVAGDGDEVYWDPNRGEYKTPADYPMGTVNVVVPDSEGSEFSEDYVYDVQVQTSVVPQKENPHPYSYTPGWD